VRRQDAQGPALWRTWLGRSGIPAPLDRFLAKARVDQAVFKQLVRAAAWSPTAVAVLDRGPPPPGGAALCDRLRGLDPREVLAVAGVLAGDGGPPHLRRAAEGFRARLRSDRRWEARCLLSGVPAGFAPHVERWARQDGADAVLKWLGAQTTRPPLWVRPRGAGAAEALRGEGFQVTSVDGALRVTGEPAITSTDAFRSGRIEVQDLASQRCGALAAPDRGGLVWDVCAGRGGKTTQLADALYLSSGGPTPRGRGAVHATDVDRRKLEALRVRVRRAGLADVVRIRAWDGLAVPPFGHEVFRGGGPPGVFRGGAPPRVFRGGAPPRVFRGGASRGGGFDVVLVDAPCSATGTWRRNPDARLRVEPGAISGFAALQARLLGLGAEALGERGRLVYATCSWCLDEDEEVVARVAAERGLHVVSSRRFGPPDLDSDTMFAAVLTRRA
jgi:16S rRNA (cytosine967-C5)-methyltransferase